MYATCKIFIAWKYVYLRALMCVREISKEKTQFSASNADQLFDKTTAISLKGVGMPVDTTSRPDRDTIAKRVLISTHSNRSKSQGEKILRSTRRKTLHTMTCQPALLHFQLSSSLSLFVFFLILWFLS